MNHRDCRPCAALALVLSLVFATGCDRAAAPKTAEKPTALLLVTIDTLRPDALGFVSGNGKTPAIDRLSRESFRLPGAVTPVPLTLPAHVSLFTGIEPHRHGVRDNGQVLGPAPPTLAELLQARGFRTGAVVSGFPLKRMFGLDRGFEHYDDAFADTGASERRAALTTAAALEWLGDPALRKNPWFLWVHYYDPHTPYEPPGGPPPADPREAYLGEVAAVDAAIATLLDGLAALEPDRARLTVITADHGESLGEHGEATHGFFVYDATMLVPALWHAPGLLPPGESRKPARLVDFAPTALELLGAPAFAVSDGVSLRPTLVGEEQVLPPAYLETLQPWLGYGWSPLHALRTADAKLIEAPTPELYRLADDPTEQQNRFADDPAGDARRLAGQLRERRALEPLAQAGQAADAETLATLRSLGYTGSVAGTREAPDGLADPKDRIRQKVLLDLAEDAATAGSLVEALATFDVVLGKEPDNRYALLRLGQLSLQTRDYRGAVPPLERLLRLDPEQPEARFALADALSSLGQADRAVGEWREVLARQPRRAAAWSNLGTVLAGQGKMGAAIEALEKAHSLEPKNETFRKNLAASHLRVAAGLANGGDLVRAKAALERALGLEPGLAAIARRHPKLAAMLPQAAP